MIEALAPGIGSVAAPLKIAGAQMGTRMTLVQLADEGLALISPVPIDDRLAGEIDGWGRVRAIIAPNAFHHFYFADAARRYPEAALFAARGVAEKLDPTPSGLARLGDEPDPLWKAELDQVALLGAPRTNEVVFFHRPSRSLILTDLCFHFDPVPGGWTGLVLRLAGASGGLAVSRLMRTLLRDRVAVRASIEKILEWDFDRIVVTHGQVVVSGGREKLRAATADL